MLNGIRQRSPRFANDQKIFIYFKNYFHKNLNNMLSRFGV